MSKATYLNGHCLRFDLESGTCCACLRDNESGGNHAIKCLDFKDPNPKTLWAVMRTGSDWMSTTDLTGW